MKEFFFKEATFGSFLSIVITAILLVGVAYGALQYWLLYQNFLQEGKERQALAKILSDTQARLSSTTLALLAEQEQNNLLKNQIKGEITNIASTITTLDKLSKTDKELLKKYSKVYFLNENYVPLKLTNIDPTYLYQPDKPALFHTDAWPHLKEMLDAASSSSKNLEIVSAYRSFGEQASLKTGYKITYGSGANKFSADQGYSEHQLGTTVDFTTPTLGKNFSSFGKSEAYKWLLENAYKYGFILSYPQGNTYYQYEPWHWRFVGVRLAEVLHAEGKNFYDFPQREIDKYLIKIFDEQ